VTNIEIICALLQVAHTALLVYYLAVKIERDERARADRRVAEAQRQLDEYRATEAIRFAELQRTVAPWRREHRS
jgi:hypothetical protein